ncbi:MAG: hypothetical protein Q4G67_08740 [Actinomycetia bacterium]|nr:hypothetical protein [Actinomycetes bacterium]
MSYGWARGLGLKVVSITAALAVVLVLLVIAMVWALRDTPPVAAAIHHSDSIAMSETMAATLVMSRECITVRSEGQTWVPIFPSDSVRLQHDALLIDRDPHRTGDEIALVGGELLTPPEEARVPEACPPGPYWLVAPSAP